MRGSDSMAQANTNVALQGSANVSPLTFDAVTLVSEKRLTISSITKFLLNYGKKQNYTEGQYIIREGHNDKTVFIVLSGEVEIQKKDDNGQNQTVTKLIGGGIILGEMSIFLDEPRTTSVRISKETLVLEFTGDNFLNAVANIPELSMRILKSLSNKLKSTNERVVQNKICANCTEKEDKTA